MIRRLVSRLWLALGIVTLAGISSVAYASAFQLFEQDAASPGYYHAGYAVAAEDASTSFYNPAGLTRFKRQQLVFATDGVVTNFKYAGGVTVNTYNSGNPYSVTAQGGSFAAVPALYYTAPLSDSFNLGFSVDVPFGLQADYGHNTLLRYASTKTAVQVIDVSPVLAYQCNDQWSIGAGPDLQMMKASFAQVGVVGTDDTFGDGTNTVTDTAYGYHAGIRYSPTQRTSYGLSYHSQVVHHLTGTSEFSGPLAILLVGHTIQSNTARVNITLPPYTAFSAMHALTDQYTILGSVIYTQWKTIQYLTLQNVAGLENVEPSTSIVVTIPQHFRNTMNYSIGLEDAISELTKLRFGLGYDVSPVKNAYRNVQLPDNDRYIIAFGAHYQSTPTIGLDVSWNHIFFNQAHISPPPQQTGDEIITTNGNVRGGADVFGAQLTWLL